MAVLPIVKIGDPILETRAQEVPRITKKITKLVEDMIETMYEANGAGLAAPQVGVNKRIIVVDLGEGPVCLINPVVQSAQGEEIDVEGCLSIPERWVYVKRAAEIEVTGLNEKGKPVRVKAEGFLARALQHEIDHLDGILILDRSLGEAELEPAENPEEGS
ncbi:MAG: peptide deformylase [Limnochordia bacterium]|jgi:peptide deformylase|nr:peptide deformylase [Limnochordia bacterium]MDI9464817.1 peptide deformylase [Bacillota bacterium]NLO96069.1 peptide deformylase [Bacillota bacterium]HAN95201.1 peptide deformylase [Bacillota bacterium]HOB39723.1 peptide deformylase [Limnochordia bacterium]